MALSYQKPPVAPTTSSKPKPLTGVMNRNFETHTGPMERPFEQEHVLAGEYVGRADALRFILELVEQRRLEALRAAGQLNPKDHPDIVDEITTVRASAADALSAAEATHDTAKSTRNRLRSERRAALRDKDIRALTREERRLAREKLEAREGTKNDRGRAKKWGWETYERNIKWADHIDKPLSKESLERHTRNIAELKEKEETLERELDELRERRAQTVVDPGSDTTPPRTLGKLEADLEAAEQALANAKENKSNASSRVAAVGKVGAGVTAHTLVGYFLAAYERRLADMDARALLVEYEDKVAKYPGLMPEWANWMAVDFAGLYYSRAGTTWHDPRTLLLALAEGQAQRLDEEIAKLDQDISAGGPRVAELTDRRTKLDADRQAIRAKRGPKVARPQGKGKIEVGQLTKYLTRAQIGHLDDQQALGLLVQHRQALGIPLAAWRYIVAKTRLRLDAKIVRDLMNEDGKLPPQPEDKVEKTPDDGEALGLETYYPALIEATRKSQRYINKSVADPEWNDLLSNWRKQEFNAWRRRGQAEVKEKGAHRTTVLQKSSVCNETAEAAQLRRGQTLPGGLWRNVRFYTNEGHFKRLTNKNMLIPGASIFKLRWMDQLRGGGSNGARYHDRIPYVTEGKRRIFPRGPNSGRVIGDWKYYPRVGEHSIARMIPDSGPRPLASGGRDPNEPHAEGAAKGDTQYLQWKHQATVTHSPWSLGNQNVVVTWETRHGGGVSEHLGFRSRKLSSLVGHWNVWVGWTQADEQHAAKTDAEHEAALADATAVGLPEVEPGAFGGSSSELTEE